MHHRLIKISFSILLLLLILKSAIAAAPSFTAKVDRNQVALGDSLTLTLSVQDDQRTGTPDLSALSQDFTILSTGQNVRMNRINGQTTLLTQWIIQLSPNHQGTLTIPAIQLGSLSTQAMTITVTDANTTAGYKEGDSVFLETSINDDNPYVQSEIIYTIKLFYDTPLIRAALTEPSVRDAVVMALGDDLKYQTTLDGKPFNVIERRYAMFPQASGELTIKAPILTGGIAVATHPQSQLQQFFGTGGQTIQRRAPDTKVTVKAKPAKASSDRWLPASDLKLIEHWSEKPLRFEEGQAITREITIAAEGLEGAQLPPIPTANMANMNTYPDQAIVESIVDNGHIVGIRKEKIAYVPTQAGQVTLPEIAITWWNTSTDKEMTARIPARTVTVAKASNNNVAQDALQLAPAQNSIVEPESENVAPTSSPAAEAEAEPQFFWPIVAGILFILWLATLILFFMKKSKKIPKPKHIDQNQNIEKISVLKKRIETACANNNARTVENAMLDWARLTYENTNIHNLIDLSKHIDSAELVSVILALDKALYQQTTTPWQGERFWQVFHRYQPKSAKIKKNNRDSLSSLYLDS